MQTLRRYALTLLLILPGAAWAQPAQDPGPCAGFPDGQADYVCTCAGDEQGSVWGSGPYTADSALCVAARHAGAVGAEGGAIRALARPGRDAYPGSTANGVTTADWGAYGASVEILPLPVAAAACGMFPAGAAEHRCSCTGAETGAVWGSGPYTADSSICVAARHAGVIGPTGGEVLAFGRAGQPSYAASTNNGITTSAWGGYGASFDFGPIPMPPPTKP